MVTLAHPDQLTNAIIQRMGHTNISVHKKLDNDRFIRFFDSFKQDSTPIAIKMSKYDEGTSAYERWKFLASCFAELSITSSLAQVLYHMFSTTFNNDKIKPFELINSSKKHNASIDEDKIFTAAEESYALKLVVDEFYVYQLRAEAMLLNPDYDTKSSNLKNNPTALSNNDLNAMGKKYFANVRAKTKLFSANTSENQALAVKLSHYQEQTDSFMKWMMLADSYASLRESRGPMSDAILDLFYQSFGHGCCTRLYNYDFKHEYISPSTVAIALKGMVSEWYANQFHATIKMHQHQTMAKAQP